MPRLVMKFGGSAVGTTTALTQVLSIVLHEQERWKRLLVVVSAALSLAWFNRIL